MKVFHEDILFECLEYLLNEDLDEHSIEFLYKIIIEFGTRLVKLNAIAMMTYFEKLEHFVKTTQSLSLEFKDLLVHLLNQKHDSFTKKSRKREKKRQEIKNEYYREKDILKKEVTDTIAFEMINKAYDITSRSGNFSSSNFFKNQFM